MTHPEIIHTAGETIDGFTIQKVTPVPEVRAVAYEIEHRASGGRLVHLHADDPENLFSISFPTPPPDDTGVPHILEHAVLGGSRRFPVREPFFEMIKMSMATFLNAMTGPDCTYYPVASNVRQDLLNLAEVYFDAVFHPLLSKEVFQREGHHLAPADTEAPTGDLIVTGIVYNEMKGARSDPESLLQRAIMRGLFPDTLYGRSSGGEPAAIPDLTYEAFKTFHQRYYHPGNAHFFTYGDMPAREWLSFLSERLAPFGRESAASPIVLQPRWLKPRLVEERYSIGAGEPVAEKTFLTMTWLTGDAGRVEDLLPNYILSLVVLGNEAAPLRRAIIDAGLGADLVASGAFSLGREGVFSIGTRGSESDRLEDLQKLVTDTLRELAAQPLDPQLVAAAFQQASYHYLEIQPMFPLHAMDRVLDGWLYSGNPLEFLTMASHLEEFRKEYERDPGIFGRLIDEKLLANPHRLDVVLRPDAEVQEKTDSEFRQRMGEVRAGLNDEQTQAVATAHARLEELNSTPNSPEALAKLPQLSISDLPERLVHIPAELEQIGASQLLHTDVFANGVCYLLLSFDLRQLPGELVPLLPRYIEAFSKLGAAGQDFVQIARSRAATTGGIAAGVSFSTHATDPDEPVWRMTVRLKTLDHQIAPALALLGDLLFGLDPNDLGRLKDVLVQSRMGYRTGLVRNGLQTASLHAARGLTHAGQLSELTGGLPQLALTERFADDFEASADELVGGIDAIRRYLVAAPLIGSVCGAVSSRRTVAATLADWAGRRDGAGPATQGAPSQFVPFTNVPMEGLAGPMQVAHCAQVIPAPHLSHPDEGLLRLGSHLVRMDYILTEIRFKGNAYGGRFSYSTTGQSLTLGSYRDPHVARTLQVFRDVPKYIREAQWRQIDIDRAIISTAKNDLQPVRPAEVTSDALRRHTSGLTQELRDERYARLRRGTPEEVKRALLDALANLDRAPVCVVSSREKLEQANQELGEPKLEIQDIVG